jgi:hypothetical protein
MAGDGEEADGKADTAWIARVKEEEKREMTNGSEKLRIGDTPRDRSNGYQERRPSCCAQGIRQRKGILDKSKSSPRARSGHTRSELPH